MNIQQVSGGVCAAKGFKAAGVHCGIRKNKNKADLAMILCDVECNVASVYTQNKVQGAPIRVTRENTAGGKARGILCNSGNANTCNPGGYEFAKMCCGLAARASGLAAEDFIIASTGVIGQPMPEEPFVNGIPAAFKALSAENSDEAGYAIMTTDTVLKNFSYSFTLEGKTCHIGAIAKGSGMINPNMATMLVFITTDVAIGHTMLQKALSREIVYSLNQINVDGDTSTNDMATIMASGLAGNSEINAEGQAYNDFCAALHTLCQRICRAIAADGEGATKYLECIVRGADTPELARKIAKSVISSDLFKAAMFGQDANWGRALCAIGYVPGNFSVDNIALALKSKAGDVLVCKESAHFPYSEEKAARILAEKEIQILVDMGSGSGEGVAYGCDLTYEYVKINGDYRT